MNTKDKIIVALDVNSEQKALLLVKTLKNNVGIFKVGLQLFTACGPNIIKKIKNAGGKVFMDLKMCDIPNTVAKAAREATKLGLSMLTLHASGGVEMLKSAKHLSVMTAKEMGIEPPKLLAVTILTSLDLENLHKMGIEFESIEQAVLHLAALAYEEGEADGIVCSPKEIKAAKKLFGDNFTIVTPGVRPVGSGSHDQKRIATPAEAIANGADYIVVGRPITQASDPVLAARQIAEEIETAGKIL